MEEGITKKSLVDLPVVYFDKIPLFSIAQLVGKPLKINASTATINHPNIARSEMEGKSKTRQPQFQMKDKLRHTTLQLKRSLPTRMDVDESKALSGLDSIQRTRAITFVSAKCTHAERRILWYDLVDIAAGCSWPWAICGDFNAIGSVLQYLGLAAQNRVRNSHPIWKLLDRILVNYQWEALFPDSGVTHLSCLSSDHSLLLWMLQSNDERGSTSLRFQAMWIYHHSFLHAVEASWSQPIMGSGMLALSIKLRWLKAC
ncbi:hypothetical protein ACH5RR_012853 [Cinchona calisaya]|uniref:Endonuclease/exonuclease/phosphatase domain-containing protein n=1 Tax=Cinchona calisaya TaxID=153742 RepID=A0ABD3ACH9_9GENT